MVKKLTEQIDQNKAGLTTKNNASKKKLQEYLDKAEADVLGPIDESER